MAGNVAELCPTQTNFFHFTLQVPRHTRQLMISRDFRSTLRMQSDFGAIRPMGHAAKRLKNRENRLLHMYKRVCQHAKVVY